MNLIVEEKKLDEEKDELKEQKDKELQAAEKRIVEQDEKYRAYLEKAKVVIKSLDPRNSTSSNNEVQILKAQLAEKDKVIKQLTVCLLVYLFKIDFIVVSFLF